MLQTAPWMHENHIFGYKVSREELGEQRCFSSCLSLFLISVVIRDLITDSFNGIKPELTEYELTDYEVV